MAVFNEKSGCDRYETISAGDIQVGWAQGFPYLGYMERVWLLHTRCLSLVDLPLPKLYLLLDLVESTIEPPTWRILHSTYPWRVPCCDCTWCILYGAVYKETLGGSSRSYSMYYPSKEAADSGEGIISGWGVEPDSSVWCWPYVLYHERSISTFETWYCSTRNTKLEI